MSDRGAMGRWLVIVASVVVVATLVAAIIAMGSPSAQRAARLDASRVQDLEQIVQAVDYYVEANGSLPPDLATLANQPGQRLSITDPVDAAPYVYEVTAERAYRLCAVFNTDTAKPRDAATPWLGNNWNHGAGRQCFERKVDKRNG